MLILRRLCIAFIFFKKIEAGERDIQEGRTLSHKDAVERLSRKWQN